MKINYAAFLQRRKYISFFVYIILVIFAYHNPVISGAMGDVDSYLAGRICEYLFFFSANCGVAIRLFEFALVAMIIILPIESANYFTNDRASAMLGLGEAPAFGRLILRSVLVFACAVFVIFDLLFNANYSMSNISQSIYPVIAMYFVSLAVVEWMSTVLFFFRLRRAFRC